MKRVQFITHKGKRILLEDFSFMKPGKDYARLLKETQKMISKEPEKSVLAVFDATGCSFTEESLKQTLEFTKANTPYIKGTTVVGISGLLQIAHSAITDSAGRDFIEFPNREEAMEYLVNLE